MTIDISDLLVLSCIEGIGPSRLKALVSHFGQTAAVLDSDRSELNRVEGIDRRTAAAVAAFTTSRNRIDAERYAAHQLKRTAAVGGRIVSLWDEEYPFHLRNAYAAPPYLFLLGQAKVDTGHSMAVVGTRSPSAYGIRMAGELTASLVAHKFAVISGLARGIDTIAHRRSVELNGITVAVIGSGLDVPYPPENGRLAERIARSGLIISEFPMGTKPDAVNFPRRNRIISGMSLGTVVVETAPTGGAMITASFALEQNREVFAVPGPVSPKRESGTHQLIKEGRAKLTESIDDILEEIQPDHTALKKTPPPAPEIPLTLFELRVYEQVGNEPVHVDVIASTAGLPVKDTLVELLHLEIKGMVQQLAGKLFRRT